jgi:Leucine-rich repeat (LRR) protein
MNLSRIPDLTGARSLSLLSVASNALTEAHGFQGSDELEGLDLSGNRIARISELPNRLKHLQMNENRLSSLDGVEKAPFLETLQAGSNGLTSMAPVRALVALKSLDLNNNKIRRVEGLEACHSLTWLNLSANKLKDWTALSSLHEGCSVWLKGTGIPKAKRDEIQKAYPRLRLDFT